MPSARGAVRLDSLDLLRFVAALAVTLYHFVACYPTAAETHASAVLTAGTAITRYGYLGVDLFFMISGFVILWSSQGRTALDFTVSRVSRLYPSFWASVIFSALCIYFLVSPLTARFTPPPLDVRTLAANATMLPTIFGAERVEGVYWTLEIEIRFYALVFALLLFRQIARAELWLNLWLAVTVLSLCVDLPGLVNYFAITPYGGYFAAGGIFFLVMTRGWTPARIASLAVSLATCIYVALEQRPQFITADRQSLFVVPCLIALFFGLLALLITHGPKLRPSRWFYWLGALTYPLYLTHATMGYLVYLNWHERIGPLPTIVLITVLAMLVALAITRAVDIPARKPFAKLLYRMASVLPFRTGSTGTAKPASPQ